MDLEFYILVLKNQKAVIISDQGYYENNIYKRFLSTENLSLEEDTVYLVNIDIETLKITNVITIYHNIIVPNSERKKIEKHNKELLKQNKIKNNLNKKNIIPIPDDLYIKQITWDFLVSTLKLGLYPLLIGPKGCGKTETIYELGKVLGYKVYPVNCGTLLKPKTTLIGTVKLENNQTSLVQSEFLNHFVSDEKVIIFLDELSRTPKDAVNYMMTILDKKQSYIYIDELAKIVYKGKNVLFAAAANFGIEYVDTRNQDGAFMDRFTKFKLNYLKEDEEVSLILKRIPNAPPNDIKKLVQIANSCRKQIENLQVSVSTRQMLEFAKYFDEGFTLSEILDNIFKTVFLNANSTEEEEDNLNKIIDAQN